MKNRITFLSFAVVAICLVIMFSFLDAEAAVGDYLFEFGSYGSGDGQFNHAWRLTLDRNGNIYVADRGNHRIQVFDSNGNFLRKWGSYGNGDGQFYYPQGVAVDQDGNVYVADANNARIQVFDSSGNFLRKWGSYGGGDAQFAYPSALALDGADNLYVSDEFFDPDPYYSSSGFAYIKVFDLNGTFLRKWGGSQGVGNDQFCSPFGIAIDQNGDVYVADSCNNRIQVFDSNGTFLRKWGGSGDGDGQFGGCVHGVALDRNGNVYAGGCNSRIQVFDSNGTFLKKWGSHGSGEGQFSIAAGIAISDSGYVYASDLYNNRIQVFEGIVTVADIEVSPGFYDFGTVQWGQTSTAMFTISNVGGSDLTISEISLTDALGVFSITSAPSLPNTLAAGQSAMVEVTFSPPAIQSYTGALLKITSDDADDPWLDVPLSGTGVLADTPSEQVAAVIDYIKNSIATGELTGEGPGNSADKRVNALINMIEATGDLLEEGQIGKGCQQLSDIYFKVNGVNYPPDFVSGPATAGLASGIEELMEYYGCE